MGTTHKDKEDPVLKEKGWGWNSFILQKVQQHKEAEEEKQVTTTRMEGRPSRRYATPGSNAKQDLEHNISQLFPPSPNSGTTFSQNLKLNTPHI